MLHRSLSTHTGLLLAAGCLLVAGCASNAPVETGQTGPLSEEARVELNQTLGSAWYKDGEAQVGKAIDASINVSNQPGAARNLILFVGDGMGISTVTAARIFAGQREGDPGEEHQLSWGSFPFSGLVKTYNVDAQTPDSAGTMTAMASGVKTEFGILGISEAVVRGNCASTRGQELLTSVELAEMAGMSTGVISTARITHATPAANYAKSADRDWEDDGDMPAEVKADGCEDIASQLISFEKRLEQRFPGADVDGIEVVMGGGRRHFLPKDADFNTADAFSAVEGDREDGRNLVSEWQRLYPDGVYVMDDVGFNLLNTRRTNRVLGLFNESHMQYEAHRGKDKAGEPSLSEMTAKAIEILDDDPDGFLLMIESGRVDHAHHAGNAYNALNDAAELSEAVQTALNKTGDDTLILVTADHSHTFTIAGYPRRGNPILGKVVMVGQQEYVKAEDGLPYTTVGYRNGQGFRDYGDQTEADIVYVDRVGPQPGRHDLTEVDTTAPGFHQEVLVPGISETHGGEDVGVYGTGPGAHLITGTIEQSVIFHVMNHAGNLLERARAKLGGETR